MAKEDHVEMEGTVKEVFPGGTFRVVTDEDHVILAHLGGKMRKFRIRVLRGDRVIVAVSPYDLTRGRITYRQR